LIKAKHILLVAILAVSAWALWPPRAGDDAVIRLGARRPGAEAEAARRPYHIRMAPGLYLPGTMPGNVGKPLAGLLDVAEKFEELYPDTYVEFVGTPAVREWLVTQLAAGLAPDILNVNVEDVWQDVQKGWYVPLDAYLDRPSPFAKPGEPGSKQWWDVFKYQAITRGKAAPDGKSYCVSYDMVETGIFYNKDILERLGLGLPKDWVEFLAMQKRLAEAGYVPLLVELGPMSDWGVDLIFDQLYAPILDGIDLVKDPVREPYLQGYLDWDEICFLYRKGFFTRKDPRWVELWRILKTWRQYWNRDISTADMMRLFVTQKGAMYWSASWTVQQLARDPDIPFRWGVFYLPPIPASYSPYADGHDMCVIGGSAMQYVVTNTAFSDTGDPATSERLRRAVAFLQFLTLPENADRVINEVLSMLPNVKGVEPHPELQPFDDFLKRPYTTTKWSFTFDMRFNEILVRMLDLYLNDGIAEDDYLAWTERNLRFAVETTVRRKKVDFDALQRTWDALAPARRHMKGLPDGAR
jgi:ABC-type glycerol-3-phosphate transport system substrate-binding protein